MAIRTEPDRVTTHRREQHVPSRSETAVPWPREEARTPVPEPGEGKPSLAGRPHPDRPDRQVGPAGRVIIIGLACFLLWGLLAAPSLRRSAESAPLGIRRTVALAVLRPLSRASSVLGLDRLESAVVRGLGRTHTRKAIPPLAGTLGLDPIKLPSGTMRPDPSQSPPKGPDSGVRPPPTALPSKAEPAITGLLVHRPTKAHPLRVLAVGDSVGEDLAIGLARALSGRKSFILYADARQSTGLARPDYFDWPYQVAMDLGNFQPDVVVAAFGANDGQSFLAGGHAVRLGIPEWKRIYRQRAGRIMAEVTASGRPLIWVGMPPMGSHRLSQNMLMIDGLVRAEARRHRGVLYVDSWDLFSGSGGGYSAYLPSASGEQELVRTPDGIHLTAAGLFWFEGVVLIVFCLLCISGC
jgi:lysophospholipase L1-like esterase